MDLLYFRQGTWATLSSPAMASFRLPHPHTLFLHFLYLPVLFPNLNPLTIFSGLQGMGTTSSSHVTNLLSSCRRQSLILSSQPIADASAATPVATPNSFILSITCLREPTTRHNPSSRCTTPLNSALFDFVSLCIYGYIKGLIESRVCQRVATTCDPSCPTYARHRFQKYIGEVNATYPSLLSGQSWNRKTGFLNLS